MVEKLERASRAFPHRPEPYYYIASAERLLGSDARASDFVELGLRSCPDGFLPLRRIEAELRSGIDGPILLNVSRPLVEWERLWLTARDAVQRAEWSEAANAYADLIASFGEEGEPYTGAFLEFTLARGIARLEAGEPHDALLDFAAARALWPGFLEPGLLLGKTLHQMGQKEAADRAFLKEWEAASENKRREIATWVSAIYGSRDPEKRNAWARRAGGALPHNLAAWDLWYTNHDEEAIAEFRAALAQDQDDIPTIVGLGFALLSRVDGRAGEALEREVREIRTLAERAIQSYPPARLAGTRHEMAVHAWCLHALAVCPSDLDLAEQSVHRAIECYGELSSLSAFVLGVLHEKSGDLEEAERYLRRANELLPKKEFQHRYHGRVLAKLDRLEEAAEALRKAIRFRRGWGTAYGDLAGVLIEMGDLDGAVIEARRAVERPPKSHAGHENLAEALRRLGRLGEALEAVDRGVGLVPDRVRLHIVRGHVLRDVGRADEAVMSYREALALDPNCDEAARALDRLERGTRTKAAEGNG